MKLSYMGAYSDFENRIVHIPQEKNMEVYYGNRVREVLLYEEITHQYKHKPTTPIIDFSRESRLSIKILLMENGASQHICSTLFGRFSHYGISSVEDIKKLLDSQFKDVQGFGETARSIVTFLYMMYYKTPHVSVLKEQGILTHEAILSILLYHQIPFRRASSWSYWCTRRKDLLGYFRNLNVATLRQKAVQKRYGGDLHTQESSRQRELEECDYYEIVQKYINDFLKE